MFLDDYFIIDKLAKKVKETKETNDLKKQKILKGFSRLLSIFKNIYFIMKDYEDSEEFNEIKPFNKVICIESGKALSRAQYDKSSNISHLVTVDRTFSLKPVQPRFHAKERHGSAPLGRICLNLVRNGCNISAMP